MWTSTATSKVLSPRSQDGRRSRIGLTAGAGTGGGAGSPGSHGGSTAGTSSVLVNVIGVIQPLSFLISRGAIGCVPIARAATTLAWASLRKLTYLAVACAIGT